MHMRCEGSSVRKEGQAGSTRLQNLDFLRAIAITGVVLYHYTARYDAAYYRTDAPVPFAFQLGWLGVDIFFSVSAFCIFMTLESAGRIENFWAKRLARIQPAYMAGILLTFTLVSMFGLSGREASWWTALSNIFWINMIPSMKMVDNVYWSLAVEMKFYFWIGLLYFFLKGKNITIYWSIFCCFGAILLSLEDNFGSAGHMASLIAEFVLIANYAPQFLVGILAFEWPRLSRRSRTALIPVTALLLWSTPRSSDIETIMLATMAFSFCILRMPQLRFPKVVIFVGMFSYSLYLVHQNIGLMVIRELAPMIHSFTLRVFVAIVITALLATLLYQLVETRWQRPLSIFLDRFLSLILRPLFAGKPEAGSKVREEAPRPTGVETRTVEDRNHAHLKGAFTIAVGRQFDPNSGSCPPETELNR